MRIKETGRIAYTTTYVYDANGNLLTKADPTLASAAAYGYNKLNQLVSVTTDGTTASYTYNAQGIRTSKLVDGKLTRYLLDGGNVVAEVTDSAVTATYLWGANLISQTIGESTNYYLYNAHGDVVQLTDSAGSITKTYTYDAFGNETDPDETDTNPFRYCGEYFDTETGTYYLRARYYDPAIRRFTQEDTHWNVSNRIYGDNPQKINEYEDSMGLSRYTLLPQSAAIMQSGNLYAYCVSNPLSYVDPSGEIATWLLLALYAYAQAVVASPDLQFDIQMLSFDLAQGDYVSAAFSMLDIFVPGLSGSKMLSKFVRKYFDDFIGWVKSFVKHADDLPPGWTKYSNEDFTRIHIKDANGRIRVRIDPADPKTPYEHIHIYDENGNSLDVNGNIVNRRSREAHIPLYEYMNYIRRISFEL